MHSTEDDKLEVRSVCSNSSTRSSSLLVKAAVEARARAEAARARAEFARKEIEIRIKQAELTATLDALKEEREVEAALAEANVFEAAVVEVEEKGETSPWQAEKQHEEAKPYSKGDIEAMSTTRGLNQFPSSTNPSGYGLQAYLKSSSDHHGEDLPGDRRFTPNKHSPCAISPGPHPPPSTDNDLASLVKYLAKRSLVTDGLTKFTDRAEDYWAWKVSFNNAIEGLSLRPSEELDLLARWLGEESSKHAKRIRSIHLNNPAEGLSRVWERLQVCYGTPEAIEKSLLDRLEHFQKFSMKEPQKLRELGDLLSEIDAAKSAGYLPGLGYLDTSRGVAPVVDKLPICLQDKWMSEGTKYKKRHNVSFPPFSFFCHFIQDEADMRNDPSFKSIPTAATSTPPIHDDNYSRFGKPRGPVTVHRTEVNKTVETNHIKSSEFERKECPIHHKPHSLKMCRGFREKTLDERKAYLREQNICFRCCDSSSHQAKDCKVEIICSECNSNRHIAALHAGPAPWSAQYIQHRPMSQGGEHGEEHGGEGENDPSTVETISACTEVCGSLSGGRSCSKICPTYVYPQGHPDKKVKVYAIIDDQSNRSLARSTFFDAFGIPESSVAPYTLKTCSGVNMTNGRVAENFIIQSVDGEFSSMLPRLLECDALPDNKSEIATPEVTLAHSHLRHLAGKIHPLDTNAEIMLLLGRDIVQVHKVFERINGPVNAPFAQKLALGWVIVGDVCLGGAHKPPSVATYRTTVLQNGRPSFLPPCQNSFHVKERFKIPSEAQATHTACQEEDNVFQQTANDEKLAPSLEDQAFVEIMERHFCQEIRPLLTAVSQAQPPCLKAFNMQSFSRWQRLIRAVARLIHIVQTFKHKPSGGKCKGWHMCHELSASNSEQARQVIIKAVQQECFSNELRPLEEGKNIPKGSPLTALSPYLDQIGLLRIGGRLLLSDLDTVEKTPLILPRKHHLTNLLIRYYHESIRHQGRHLTEGALRSAGYWILGGKRQISSHIHSCVVCLKLRGGTQSQKMANLPRERLSIAPPFTYVGIDVFGPWSVTSRRTRGGFASSKRWAVMFTCMSTRAVHIEAIESMDTSSFINALRRFFSLRGPAKQLRSDCGTNFKGACKELDFDAKIFTDSDVRSFITSRGCTLVFNPPHASHMGGSWEQMIGIARRILDCQLAQLGAQRLSHEVLTTFFAEVAAIMNGRPLVPVSSDPEAPFILTPATLLTQKVSALLPPPGDFEEKDLYRRQWKQVQSLANSFWHRWRKEYLSTLQGRRKCHSARPNLRQGDVVLLKDPLAKRNQWPMGLIVKAIPSSDGHVRKVEVKVVREGDARIYLRPVTDVVLLLSDVIQQN